MFGIKTRVRLRLAKALRETVGLTPLIYGDDPKRARIAEHTSIMDAILNVSSGTITIEEYVFFGHGVALLTGTHDPSRRGLDRMTNIEREGRDIRIGTGAWLASNVTVLGPCRIGEHAVVAAGAVVRRDVEPREIVGGVPARHLGWTPERVGTDGAAPSA